MEGRKPLAAYPTSSSSAANPATTFPHRAIALSLRVVKRRARRLDNSRGPVLLQPFGRAENAKGSKLEKKSASASLIAGLQPVAGGGRRRAHRPQRARQQMGARGCSALQEPSATMAAYYSGSHVPAAWCDTQPLHPQKQMQSK